MWLSMCTMTSRRALVVNFTTMILPLSELVNWVRRAGEGRQFSLRADLRMYVRVYSLTTFIFSLHLAYEGFRMGVVSDQIGRELYFRYELHIMRAITALAVRVHVDVIAPDGL